MVSVTGALLPLLVLPPPELHPAASSAAAAIAAAAANLHRLTAFSFLIWAAVMTGPQLVPQMSVLRACPPAGSPGRTPPGPAGRAGRTRPASRAGAPVAVPSRRPGGAPAHPR